MPPTAWLDLGTALVIGLVFGSFLNVCVHRIPLKESVVNPPSHCPFCKKNIVWYHNIPIFSWLWLKARCAYCHHPIHWRYPLMELLGGVVVVMAIARFGSNAEGWLLALFGLALLLLSAIDMEKRILPNIITYPLLVVGVVCSALPMLGSPFPSMGDALLGMVVGAGGLLVLIEVWYRVTGRVAMGLGDVKLVGVLSAWLGWQALYFIIFGSALLGVVVGGGWLIWGGKEKQTPIPFGPFLALSAWIYLFLDESFKQGYLLWMVRS
ncbi:type 4 prepilin peptidase 1, Aspartic peptidase, MEROPS family A24A [Magnetococcus marinus MC-1]|uniref:Prepilin leader peptidase/N-methyltransferase n=1 Tax=Magnetococcus marinus (strain ATCC BAA-1437 / JCM 17883 / MC-1) TaxID=156889 RepID=A0L3K7_MAGMM|nr:type 4 prepilin peptidase 1, Aspartic peptidase, MEROPS family A24A [Magnetococcus marinus MC-1]